jgi:hypothetical protein
MSALKTKLVYRPLRPEETIERADEWSDGHAWARVQTSAGRSVAEQLAREWNAAKSFRRLAGYVFHE